MSSNAIFEGAAYHVIGVAGHEVELHPVEGDRARTFWVNVMAPTLIIDPTDDQWFAARKRRASTSARLR
ncbi:MAG: hypothetical protein M3067_16210 [Chloroflexota bacterium]|nr:hypothetical protein [Chloroflexota bacterium]